MNVKECDVKVIYRRLFCDCGLEMVRDKTLQTQRGFEYTYICYKCNVTIIDRRCFPAIEFIDSDGNEIR